MASIPLPTSSDQDDAYFRTVLLDLVDRGCALAHQVHERAMAAPAPAEDAPGPTVAPDPTIAFERVARTIRRTIALARHIAAGPATTQTTHTQTTRTPAHRTAARATLIRGVEDAIHRKSATGIETGQLHADLTEILEDPALEFDLGTRPIPDIIDEICRDLGVFSATRSFVFKQRSPAERTALHNQALHNPALHSHAQHDHALAPPHPGRTRAASHGPPPDRTG